MKIDKIYPERKRGQHQYYTVYYEEHYKKCSFVDKRKNILKFFQIDKKEFEMILRNSMLG